MPRGIKKEPEKDKLAAPSWMVTFSDMVTQVLAFFVMLVAVSQVDEEKFNAIMSILRREWLGGPGVLEVERRPTVFHQGFDPERIGATVFRLHPGVEVEYERTRTGLKFTIWGEGLFEEGKAELKKEAWVIIDRIVENYVKGYMNKVEVRGHCSTAPSRDERYPDHWDLSYARAKVTMAYAIGSIENPRVEPYRMRATGASTFEPVGPNYTAEQRQKNDRVEIIILEELAKPH